MKNVKKFLLIASVGFTLASCGSKGEVKENETPKAEICPCTDVIEIDNVVQKNGKAYTGACEELDQHSVATKHKDFVNGKLVSKFYKKRLGDHYFTYDSLTFESGNPYNGYSCEYTDSFGIWYIKSVQEFKDGKKTFDGSISLDVTSRIIRYYDRIDYKNGNFEVTSGGDLDNYKADFIAFLKNLKEKNPKFEFFGE
jgi:hypothetical protein